ncbi:MAG: hypothetical protein ABIZ70_09200 [Gemmatimonadales bacterium]
MKPIAIRRICAAVLATSALMLAACAGSNQPQGGVGSGMMGSGPGSGNGWMHGYGGAWMPVLLVVLVALVAWIAVRGRTKR